MNRRKKFLSYYKPYNKLFAIVLLCAALTALMGVLFPLCVKHLTDTVLQGEITPASVISGTLLLLVTACVGSAAHSFFDYYGHCVGANMENDLRQELFSHLEKLSFSFFDTHRVGTLMSALTNDLLELSELYHHGPEDYLMNGIQFVGACIAMFTISPALLLCIAAFFPVMAFLTLKLNRRVQKASEENQENIANINAAAEDALSGIRVSQAFCRENFEERQFAKHGDAFSASRKKIYLAEAMEYQVLNLLTKFMYVAVTLTGAVGIWKGFISVSGLIACLLYISSLSEPLIKLAWMTTQFRQGLAGFNRVCDILEIKPEITDKPDAIALEDPQGTIRFEDVTFSYRSGTDTVLSHIDMTISAGETVAVVGASGAGKTTLSALIPRFYDTVSGRISIDGHDVRDIRLDSLRAAISLVQQDTFLFSSSVADNIRYAKPDADMTEIRAAAKNAAADEFIQNLPQGYDTDVGPRGVRLSGGQRQRIAIARAFLRSAPILILDEATSALDRDSESIVHRSVRELRKGRTTLIIAHRLSTVMDADRIIVLDENGAIAESGTPDELLRKTNGVFAALYNRKE